MAPSIIILYSFNNPHNSQRTHMLLHVCCKFSIFALHREILMYHSSSVSKTVIFFSFLKSNTNNNKIHFKTCKLFVSFPLIFCCFCSIQFKFFSFSCRCVSQEEICFVHIKYRLNSLHDQLVHYFVNYILLSSTRFLRLLVYVTSGYILHFQNPSCPNLQKRKRNIKFHVISMNFPSYPHPLLSINNYIHLYQNYSIVSTLYQTKNFRLVQIKSICRRQFKSS